MRRPKLNWKCGLFAGGAITIGLLIIPPLLVPYFEGWKIALARLPHDEEVVAACGENSVVRLSRWFYTIKVTGAGGYAKFHGRAFSEKCNHAFVVELERKDYLWRIAKVDWNAP